MKYKKKIKVSKKIATKEDILNYLGIKENEIEEYITILNLVKIGRLHYADIEPTFIGKSLIQYGIVSDECVEENMKKIKDMIAIGANPFTLLSNY